MVIVHHALDQFSGFKNALPTDMGKSGVDIFFFVISGFIRLTQKEHARLHFVVDASYLIYLIHLFAVIFMRIVWPRLGLPVDGLGWALVFIAACFAGGAGLKCLTYVTLERPATAWAKALLI